MKRQKLLVVVLCSIIGALSIWLWCTFSPKHDEPTQSKSTEGSVIMEEDRADVSKEFQIRSDTQTATGRVVRVSKDAKQSEIIIPLGMQVSDEELKAMAFPELPTTQPPRAPGAGLNRRLFFYGITVDEQTNALPAVRIEANIKIIRPGEQPQPTIQRLTSGPDGRFTVEADWGQTVLITVSKGGYIAPEAEVFRYGPIGVREPHTPSIRDPVRFVLHKKMPPEPLFTFEKRYRIPNTGQPVNVDLTTGRIVAEGGDLTVSIYMPEPYTNLRPFPWKLSVEVVDGGLLEVPSNPPGAVRLEHLHEAPTEGYETGFGVEYGSKTPIFRSQFEGIYYVMSRNGQVYAKMWFDMTADWDNRGIPFGINAVVNTNASRNLQTPDQR